MRPPFPSADLDLRPASARAYEALLPEILAVPDDHLAGASVDVTAAIDAVARLLSTLRDLGPILETIWHGLDCGQLDRLELCTLALQYADSRWRRAPDDKLCARIRQQALTLFLSSYDDLQDTVDQLLQPEPLPARQAAAPCAAPDASDDPERDDEPAPVTLVSVRTPEQTTAERPWPDVWGEIATPRRWH